MTGVLARALVRLLATALLAGTAASAHAHRFHAGMADIAFNAASGSVEVVHTYMAHDIEALLATRGQRQADLTSADDEAQLRAYIEQRFYLLDAGGARLPLKWVGMTARVDSVVVYQEVPATALSAVAAVHDAVLTDLLPRQLNTVNVRADGATRSLQFDAATVERRIR
jgi:hypothetical protein